MAPPRALAVSAVLVTVLLAGCGGSGAATPARTSPARTSPAPTSAVPLAPPVSVASAPAETDAQAVERAVRSFYAAVNRSYDTLDPSPLELLTDQSCPCRDQVALLRRLLVPGAVVSGGRATVDSLGVVTIAGDRASAQVVVSVAAGSVTAPDGTVTPIPAEVGSRQAVLLVRSDVGWLISAVTGGSP